MLTRLLFNTIVNSCDTLFETLLVDFCSKRKVLIIWLQEVHL
jgi:hypothetical protein